MATQLERREPHAVGVERTRDREVIVPRVDIWETHDEIVLMADMPGVNDKSVDIVLEQDVLTIEGHPHHQEAQGLTAAMTELVAGYYRRVFTLATEVDRDQIKAEMKHGVLRLVLPKAEPAKAKKITVQVH